MESKIFLRVLSMILFHWPFKFQDLILVMVIILLRLKISSLSMVLCKPSLIISTRLIMLPLSLLINTKTRNSSGKRLQLIVSKLSYKLVMTQEPKNTLKLTKIMRKKLTTPSNGWLIKSLRAFKRENHLLKCLTKQLLLSTELEMISMFSRDLQTLDG